MSEPKTVDIVAALRNRYLPDRGEWAFFTEVPNGTGMNKDRACDAIAMNLWPSKGLVLHGHEIKASRSDWLKEIQDPSKSEAFARYCDYWWIAASAKIVKIEELPANWGWMTPTKSGVIRVKKPATKRERIPIDRDMLAGILRAASKANASENDIRNATRDEYDRGYAAGRKIAEQFDARDREVERLRKKIEELDNGVAEVKALKNSRPAVEMRFSSIKRDARSMIDTMEKLIERVDDAEGAVLEGLDLKTLTPGP